MISNHNNIDTSMEIHLFQAIHQLPNHLINLLQWVAHLEIQKDSSHKRHRNLVKNDNKMALYIEQLIENINALRKGFRNFHINLKTKEYPAPSLLKKKKKKQWITMNLCTTPFPKKLGCCAKCNRKQNAMICKSGKTIALCFYLHLDKLFFWIPCCMCTLHFFFLTKEHEMLVFVCVFLQALLTSGLSGPNLWPQASVCSECMA